MDKVVVAIDGPSGTGKSTTARILAEKLKFLYIDSGAMYRAITFELLKNNIKPTDVKKIVDITTKADIKFDGEEVFLNGKNITKDIRSLDVTSKVSSVSAIKDVRKILVNKQREYAKTNDVVMDGRDIGTVVFPNAKFKFFLVCDLKTRAARRRQDFIEHGMKLPIEKIMAELKKRDSVDSTRKESPLKKAKDAVEVNTTNMIIEEQVNYLLRIVNGLD
ncbi:MAG TPA: (d)CMP kinase [Ignavibacteria bacterium]|nr:(d)CMP kinase [Bacteroidota bacterium]HRI86165.1 (d)CMP kinase [Ignavibacteria bacterium]HRK00749.1 (d)CMP kinase [Ignavibacteria bacterium]